jgi:hypothetical protein
MHPVAPPPLKIPPEIFRLICRDGTVLEKGKPWPQPPGGKNLEVVDCCIEYIAFYEQEDEDGMPDYYLVIALPVEKTQNGMPGVFFQKGVGCKTEIFAEDVLRPEYMHSANELYTLIQECKKEALEAYNAPDEPAPIAPTAPYPPPAPQHSAASPFQPPR